MRGLVTVAIVSALFAGCVALPGAKLQPASVAPTLADLTALGALQAAKHDHTDREQHKAVSVGLEFLNFSALSEDGKSLGEYGEADVQQGIVAVTAAKPGGGTFVLLDATALPAIKALSRTWDPGAYGDVKLDSKDKLLYMAHPALTVGPQVAFTIWDIADPAKPKKVGDAQGDGCHMIHPARMNNEPYVWCAGLNPVLFHVVKLPTGGYVGVEELRVTPQTDPEVARYLTYYQSLSPIGPALALTPHDLTAQEDPLTHKQVLAVAYELQGIRVYDMSGPGALEIGHWRGEGLPGPMERVHTVVLAKIGDKRIAFGATETFTDVKPVVYIVDMTDYAKPKLLSTWSPPGIEKDDHIKFSAHNLQIVGTRMYEANFHGGFWAVDVGDPAHPVTQALRVSVHDTGMPQKGTMVVADTAMDTNMIWDVVVANGYAILTDMPAGIEVVHVDGDPAGDASFTSTA